MLEPEALVKFVSVKALKAGKELYEKNSVSDLVFSGDAISGRVKGSRTIPHTTTLKLASGKPVVHCTCPTFTDGWEKFCHHAVALAMALRKHYHSGSEITTTHNPWVEEVEEGGAARQRRYQLEQRGGNWVVQVFQSGSAAIAKRSRGTEIHPADRLVQYYLDQEVERSEDGCHELEDPSLAGMLYFARDAQVSLKGVGKLKFVPEPLLLRVQAETRNDSNVDLHAFLFHEDSGRAIEVDQGRVIAAAPTWFLLPATAELFRVPETPPWVLDAIAKQPRIVMDARVDAEQMDSLSQRLQSAGVPRSDLFALASDARKIEQIVATKIGRAHV